MVTPRFWDKAATSAEETLGALSPGSRRRLSTIAETGAGDRSVKRRGGGAALTVPDLLAPSGVSGVPALAIPSPNGARAGGWPAAETPLASMRLGDMASALGNGGDASGARQSPRGRDGGRVGAGAPLASGSGAERGGALGDASANRPAGRHAATDAPAPCAVGGPMKKLRPPRLQIASDNASPLLDADLGTPLLAMSGAWGHVVGDVPGLRGSAYGSGGMTLRKAVLERWAGIPTPREQDLALTPNDMNVVVSPTQFLTTPR